MGVHGVRTPKGADPIGPDVFLISRGAEPTRLSNRYVYCAITVSIEYELLVLV